MRGCERPNLRVLFALVMVIEGFVCVLFELDFANCRRSPRSWVAGARYRYNITGV